MKGATDMAIFSDAELLTLFNSRDQAALSATEKQYGKLCLCIADHILGCREDAEECVNDALMKLWNSIPPEQPRSFAAYLSVIVRNLACTRRTAAQTKKRGGGEFTVALSEIEDTLAAPEHPEAVLDTIAIGDALNRFLDTLPAETNAMFVMRYWSDMSIKEIAARCGKSQSKVKMTLLRTRNALKTFLEQEGLR